MLHWWFTQMSLQAHYFPFLYKYDCSISSLSVSNPIGKDKPRAPTRTFRELRRDEICNGTFVFLWCRQTFTCTTNRKHFCLKQHFIALKTQCILHNFSLGKLSGKRDIYICIYIYIYICIQQVNTFSISNVWEVMFSQHRPSDCFNQHVEMTPH